jgi:cyclomaltodextrinase / maltogenic alpha-amylase / neopullulanase
MDLLFGELSTIKGRERYSRRQLRGFRHDFPAGPLKDAPALPVEIRAFAGGDVDVVQAFVAYTTDGTSPLPAGISATQSIQCGTFVECSGSAVFPGGACGSVSAGLPQAVFDGLGFDSSAVRLVEMRCLETEWQTLSWSYCQAWSALIPDAPPGALVLYAIGARLSDGRLVFCPFGTGEPDGKPAVYGYFNDQFSVPDWLSQAIIYQIIPDRFFAGTAKDFVQTEDLAGICGGTLRGIVDKLDYLERLGINCLWLTPIFCSPTHHGYDVTGYGGIEPRLGLVEDFKQLVENCRQRQIKLLLDFPANHVSSAHPFFVEARRDPESKYVSWFRFREWPDQYDCYYGLPAMPIFETENPEVRDYLIEQAIAWLDLGADGYRLDHAHGLSHLFWSHFRHAVKAVHPEAVMLAEVTQSPDRVRSYKGRMDACLDFRGMELLRVYFGRGAISSSEFACQFERHLDFCGQEILSVSSLDNHDMNRFLWLVRGDKRKLKLAALYQLLLPLPPVIYYGTEVALNQTAPVGRLEQSRPPMCWGESQDSELFSFYRELLSFRKMLVSSGSGRGRQVLKTDDARGILVLQTGAFLLVVNNSRRNQKIDRLLPRQECEPVIKTDTRIKMSSGSLHLPPYSAAVIALSADELNIP